MSLLIHEYLLRDRGQMMRNFNAPLVPVDVPVDMALNEMMAATGAYPVLSGDPHERRWLWSPGDAYFASGDKPEPLVANCRNCGANSFKDSKCQYCGGDC